MELGPRSVVVKDIHTNARTEVDDAIILEHAPRSVVVFNLICRFLPVGV